MSSEHLPPRFRSGPYPFNQKGHCHWCGGPVTAPRRRTWCSDECVQEWTIRTSPAAVRYAVWKRDHGICAECGTDHSIERTTAYGDTYTVGLEGPWDADHILPVWKGGGLAGLDGYQTLCRTPCHAAKTARDAAERAAMRRPVEAASAQMQLAVIP